jgi:hypothetical protein
MLPFLSLDEATTAGPGEARDCEGLVNTVTCIAWGTGITTQADVAIEGSHDGEHWAIIALLPLTNSSSPAISTAGNTYPGHAVRYIRARLRDPDSGTISCTLAAVAAVIPSQ